MRSPRILPFLFLPLLAALPERPIRLPQEPQLTPDGRAAVFAWKGDIWTAALAGGDARRVTTHPADDAQPRVSPDGKSLAFVSRRTGTEQVFLAALEGGSPRQLTFDGYDKTLVGFTPDGEGVLVIEDQDLSPHRSENRRLLRISLKERRAPERLFEASLDSAALSADGTKVLFTRGRSEWWRKGFQTPAAFQIWLADLTVKPVALQRLSADRPHFQNIQERWPLWAPDGKGYYFVSEADGVNDVYFRKLDGSGLRRVTRVGKDKGDDGVVFPSLSADGKTLLFRRRFDLMLGDTAEGKLRALPLRASGDDMAAVLEPRTDKTVSAVAFTRDGKQMAFVAGDDLWVMDTVLKEPVRITRTAVREDSLAFSTDGKRLYYVSEVGGEADLYAVDCPREDGAWFLASGFQPKQLSKDKAVESSVKADPTGKLVGFLKDRDLWVMKPDGTGPRKLLDSWSGVDFDWSPDGKWVVVALQDSSFNSDIWVLPVDGSRPPFNLSRHPDNDTAPRWSPDGTRIAFVGRRDGEESDVYVVTLAAAVAEETARDRTLKKALEALQAPRPRRETAAAPKEGAAAEPAARPARAAAKEVVIDFAGIHDRIHRIRLAGSERDLVWSPDGTQLGFTHSAGAGSAPDEEEQQRRTRPATPAPTPTPAPARPGTPAAPAATPEAPATPAGPAFYTVNFPDKLTPVQVFTPALAHPAWVEAGSLVGTASNVPATLALSPTKLTTHAFTVHTLRDWREYRTAVFDQAWRRMRDGFYDGSHNNREWEQVRAKYRDLAGQCLGKKEFETLVQLMLGELNSSHLGFSNAPEFLPVPPATAVPAPKPFHLGLRFDRSAGGEGLKVASVIPGSPCSLQRSLVKPGETVQAIDGTKVTPDTDLTLLLAMPESRDLLLTVADATGASRAVTVRPVASVADLLYKEWVEANRAAVEQSSAGKLGYLHIRGMNMPSFRQFEEDLYHAGFGKDGLLIDVRFNGGGSTADHVLTALTQPVHAVTIPRGGEPGYPHDRMVYATWTKPIVLLCNEFSFSNAEIVSHAIKTIGRGRLVGMRTAGGVISTGATTLQDGSTLRMPFRGWYLRDTGADMELNGAEPHIALWNPPAGPDAQLAAAVKALTEDVAKEAARPRPKLVNAAKLRK
jgi:tricorn protease